MLGIYKNQNNGKEIKMRELLEVIVKLMNLHKMVD